MCFLCRISDLISSNLHSLLDRLENPELMIAQVIRELEEGLAVARRYAAGAIAAERRLARELEQNRAESARWKQRAREALAAGREDLARQALVRKKEHDDLARGLEAHYAAALEASATIRDSLRALEARLAEARRKQRTIVARHRAAQARLELQRLGGAGIPAPCTPGAKLKRLEHRLRDLEDEWAAQAELKDELSGADAEFAELETARAIQSELDALKREAGKE
jgi:phage shock protein A